MPLMPPKNTYKTSGVFSGKKISLNELVIFCRKVFYMLNAGLRIEEALLTLQKQKFSAGLNLAISQLYTGILVGESLQASLQKTNFFPPFVAAYVAIGEETAELAQVFEKLADYYEERAKTRKEVVSALVYPCTVMLMMLGVVVLAMVTVLPGYARIFEASDITLPVITEYLMRLSAFFVRNGLVIFIITVAVILLTLLFARSKEGANVLAVISLKIPILRKGINYNFAQALSLMLNSGILVSDAVPLCANIMGNTVVKENLYSAHALMVSGNDFSVAMKKMPYIDTMLTDLAQIGEETGELPTLMKKCSEYIATDYKDSLKRLTKLIEPMLTIAMGVLLALLMLAVVLPTFELATVM